MIGTIDNCKVRIRCHAPNDVAEKEFDGPDSIEKAIQWMNAQRNTKVTYDG